MNTGETVHTSIRALSVCNSRKHSICGISAVDRAHFSSMCVVMNVIWSGRDLERSLQVQSDWIYSVYPVCNDNRSSLESHARGTSHAAWLCLWPVRLSANISCWTICGIDSLNLKTFFFVFLRGKSARFELPGKFMKVSYNDSLSD